MLKRSLAVLVLLVAACGGEEASPTSAPSSGTEPAPVLTAVPFDTWLVVDGLEGRGVPLGSGVRFRAEAFDVVARGQASSFPLSCPEDGSLACTGAGAPLTLAVVDGHVRATQPGLVLLLSAATADQAAGFEAALASADAQRAACRRTADCCVALENAGQACDLAPLLGDRSRAACENGLASLRARIVDARIEPPADCR